MRVSTEGHQPAVPGSELAVETLEVDVVGDRDADTIVFTPAVGIARLVLAGETAALGSGTHVRATVGPAVDRHAAMGSRECTVSTEEANAEGATGRRTFQVLFGPHNGSTRATLFVGYVPPGAAPWHFHLYDEIVWIWRGEGRFHTREAVEQIGPGSAFRIRPREVHIVENTSPIDELVVVGLFTPAGSPSAAYYPPEAMS